MYIILYSHYKSVDYVWRGIKTISKTSKFIPRWDRAPRFINSWIRHCIHTVIHSRAWMGYIMLYYVVFFLYYKFKGGLLRLQPGSPHPILRWGWGGGVGLVPPPLLLHKWFFFFCTDSLLKTACPKRKISVNV